MTDFQLQKRTEKLRWYELYEAQDQSKNRPVFMKIALSSVDSSVVEARFDLELGALERLHNPFFERPLARDEFESRRCLVWERRPSYSLVEVIRAMRVSGHPTTIGSRLALVLELLRRAQELHASASASPETCFCIMGGGLHNLRIDAAGNWYALGLSDVTSPELTIQPNTYSQTFPPEILVGDGPVDQRAEVYAAATMLYYVLALRPVISERKLDRALIYRLFRGVHPLVSDMIPELKCLDSIVSDAMNWFPERRYQSIDSFIKAIEERASEAGIAVETWPGDSWFPVCNTLYNSKTT